MKSAANDKLVLDAALRRMIARNRGVDRLVNADTNDPLRCRVAPKGPNCHAVWQAYRMAKDVELAANEMEIALEAAVQALAYYSLHPVQRSAEQLEWEALGLAKLFSADDAMPTEE